MKAILLPLLAAVPAMAAKKCQTELGPNPVNFVPTITETSTAIKPTTTLTVRSTVTSYAGYWYTYTTFVTKTLTAMDSTVTDTFSSTTTEYAVETDTAVSTITTTSTDWRTEMSTSTTLVPTTNGFKNIQDTVNSQSLQRRIVGHPHAGRVAAEAKQGLNAAAYPTLVHCMTTVPNTKTKTVFKTLKPATKTVPKWAWSTLETDTIRTTTTLVPPEVSVTETSTYTSQVTTFTTTFTTQTDTAVSTTTSVISGPTIWDACNDRNVFGPNFSNSGKQYYVSNVANNGPKVGSDFKTVADGASTALECCNACQAFGTCENFIFRSQNKNCFLLYHAGEKCPSQSNHPNIILSQAGSDTGSGYVVGNGNCGYAYSGNTDGSLFPATW